MKLASFTQRGIWDHSRFVYQWLVPSDGQVLFHGIGSLFPLHQMKDLWAASSFGNYMHRPAINIGVQVSVWTSVFTSLGHIPRSGIVGSYDKRMFSFILRDCSPRWLYHLASPLVRQGSSSHFGVLSALSAVTKKILSCSNTCTVTPTVIVTRTSLLASDTERLFVCCSAIHMPSLVKCLQAFCPFLNWVVCWVLTVLYTFWMQVLCQLYDLQILSHSVTCLFILLTVSFIEQRFYILIKSNLSNFSPMDPRLSCHV